MTPGTGFGVWNHRGDCGVLKPGMGFGRWAHTGDGTCDPVFIVLEGFHPGYGGHVTSGTRSVGVSPWRLWPCDPKYRVWAGLSA